MTQQPDKTDSVLGGQVPSPTSSLILGGIEGLQQRFAIAPSPEKVELLLQTINYGEAGVDLLIGALNDAEIKVRTTAYELLREITSEKARNALAHGFPLSVGDRVYHVYQSVIAYNDCWYYLVETLEDAEDWKEPELIASYLSKENADKKALLYHQLLAAETAWDLSDVGGRSEYRRNFELEHLEQWCSENQIFSRRPDENDVDFAERLRKIFGATEQFDLSASLWEQFQMEDCNLDAWYADQAFCGRLLNEGRWEFENRITALLKASQNYELLGQLWIQSAGRFTFVHEEIITRPSYFYSLGTL